MEASGLLLFFLFEKVVLGVEGDFSGHLVGKAEIRVRASK
jgi:hypothetical protein